MYKPSPSIGVLGSSFGWSPGLSNQLSPSPLICWNSYILGLLGPLLYGSTSPSLLPLPFSWDLKFLTPSLCCHQSRRYYFLSEDVEEGDELRQHCLDLERQVG